MQVGEDQRAHVLCAGGGHAGPRSQHRWQRPYVRQGPGVCRARPNLGRLMSATGPRS